MEIRILRYFLTVAREESITKAADVLHITQPTLSRQLAQMEDELGVKLFKRGTRKISLTNEGILLRRRAEEIVSLADKTEAELTEREETINGTVTIGCGESLAVQALPELIKSFREKYPLVTYDIYTATADLIKEQMDKGLIDIGLLLEPVNVENYEYIRLNIRDRSVVLMRSDDPLAEKEFVTAQDLAGKPVILPRRNSVKNEIASWFGDHYKDLNVIFTSNLATNGAIMVLNGLGYSLAVEGAAALWDKEKIAAIPLYPQISSGSVIAWKRSQPFSPAVTRFIEHIRKSISGFSE
ncbi:LysR family transcriptional regulator [Ruminococcus sp. Marseille-P6503]|uniref:LysR family transcriptional regulator n=1 Tax=Ruminococcus sp. Marseille-P6503 TaxID=2364796 RepID=UPI000F524BBA|nr:LysR family transcriptional regulator [Ruminococcus sp. Marseille-P6503]